MQIFLFADNEMIDLLNIILFYNFEQLFLEVIQAFLLIKLLDNKLIMMYLGLRCSRLPFIVAGHVLETLAV